MKERFKARRTIYIDGDRNRICFIRGSIYYGVFDGRVYFFNDEQKPNIQYHQVGCEWLAENFTRLIFRFGH